MKKRQVASLFLSPFAILTKWMSGSSFEGTTVSKQTLAREMKERANLRYGMGLKWRIKFFYRIRFK
jgi:hypothetical protein